MPRSTKLFILKLLKYFTVLNLKIELDRKSKGKIKFYLSVALSTVGKKYWPQRQQMSADLLGTRPFSSKPFITCFVIILKEN